MGYGKISKKQSEILEFIKDSILTKGYPPLCGKYVKQSI